MFSNLMSRFEELSLSAQTSYAELAEQTRTFEVTNALAGLVGSFHKVARKGKEYWYFAYREPDQRVRMIYVGPDDNRVRALVDRFGHSRRRTALVPQAQAAIVLGCAAVLPRHFRILKRIAEYGFFRAGGILVGTHAFLALGNLLGIRWRDGQATLDVDLAHAGHSVSIALPADLRVDVHDALESLEMGWLPITQFDGQAGAQYRAAGDPELRLDFVTSAARGKRPVTMPELNVALQPLKFMEFLLEDTTQGCLISRHGACTVNLPAAERYAVHKLIVSGERPRSERVKARKDLLQAASLASYFAAGQAETFNTAFRDAISRGRGWRERAVKGKNALLRFAPDVDLPGLWAT